MMKDRPHDIAGLTMKLDMETNEDHREQLAGEPASEEEAERLVAEDEEKYMASQEGHNVIQLHVVVLFQRVVDRTNQVMVTTTRCRKEPMKTCFLIHVVD